MTPGQLRAAGWVPMEDAIRDTRQFPDDLWCWLRHGFAHISGASRMSVSRKCYMKHGWWGRHSWVYPAVLPPTEPLHPSTPLICAEVLPARYRSREEREAEWKARNGGWS